VVVNITSCLVSFILCALSSMKTPSIPPSYEKRGAYLSGSPPGVWCLQFLKERASTVFLSRFFKRIVIGLDNV
jgi:hypothetical protein